MSEKNQQGGEKPKAEPAPKPPPPPPLPSNVTFTKGGWGDKGDKAK